MARQFWWVLTVLSIALVARGQGQNVPLGINLSGVFDWSTQYPFANAFRSAREWVSQRDGAGWGEGGPLALTPEGWVAELESGQYAETLLFTHTSELAAGMDGVYTLLYNGEGEIVVGGSNVTMLESAPGRMLLDAKPTQGPIFLQIVATNPQNPIRDIRLYLPGTDETMTFNPRFLEMLRPFDALRFMDWMSTNNATISTWEERPKLTDAVWSVKGVPVEIMVELANTLGKDAWFNMPHRATDDYVRSFAAYVAANLDPELTAYVEYSNETWNGIFEQASYVSAEGLAQNLAPGDAFWSGLRYYSKRAVEIFGIWQEAFAARPGTLVRVLASQAANAWTAEQIAEYENAAASADAVAIAPYFSCDDPGNPDNAAATVSAGLDALLAQQMANVQMDGCAMAYVRANLEVAQRYGLELVAYEGGQHLAGYGGAENDEALTALFVAANRDPRMEAIYRTYLQNWQALGGGAFMAFADVGEYGKFGSWGALETLTQDFESAPKFRALAAFAAG